MTIILEPIFFPKTQVEFLSFSLSLSLFFFWLHETKCLRSTHFSVEMGTPKVVIQEVSDKGGNPHTVAFSSSSMYPDKRLSLSSDFLPLVIKI